MYNESAISQLASRIGFGEDRSISVSVEENHKTGTSGRTVPSFHRLATLENLFYTVSELNMSASNFNNHLSQMKSEAAKGVLTAVMDRNKLYRDSLDYSDTIINRPELFDDAIGYTLAIDIIEQIVSSNRSNNNERSGKLSYNQLKIELDGIQSDDGRVISKGIRRDLYEAIYIATNIIFPDPLTISNANAW